MMKRMKTLARVVLTILVLVTCLTGASWGAAISGFVNYSGSQTGRIHLMLAQPDQYMGGAASPTGIGTSILITSPGKQQAAYSMQGVPIGSSYELIAFMDTATPPTGYANGTSPIGKATSLPEVTSPSQTLTNINVNVGPQIRNPSTDPNPWPLAVNQSDISVDTFSNGFVINWRGPENSYGIEVADSYDIYWSTSPTVGPGVTTNGGQALGKKAIYDNNFYIVTGLTNDTPYYVAIVATLNGESSTITRSNAVVPAIPTGNGTITGTVNIDFGSVPSGRPLYVVASHDTSEKLFAAPVMTGATTQTYAISGVGPGTYSIHAIYDVDNNHYMNDGDLTNRSQKVMVTIPTAGGTFTMPAINFKGTNSQSGVVTSISQGSGATNYELSFYLNSQLKHAAHIDFNGGPNVGATSVGIGRWGEFGYSWSVPRPTIGNQYSGTITYLDGSSEPFTVEVTGLIDTLPFSSYPSGQISGSTRSNPTLTWRPSSIPQGEYRYYLSLSDNSITNGNNTIWSALVDNNVLATPYSGTALLDNNNYNWNVTISDSYGNSASNGYGFSPVGSGPTITGISPAIPQAVGTSGVIINGSGFDTSNVLNNIVRFNGYQATVTAATTGQLTVTMPNNAATGLVTVTLNGVTTASPAVFTPTASYDAFIVDKNNIGQANVEVKRFKPSDKVTPLGTPLTTTANGNYKFAGMQTAKPYFITFAPSDTATYAPTASPRMIAFGNYSATGPTDNRNYTIMDKARIASWGSGNAPVLAQQPGKALVRTRIADNNNVNLSGVVVRAFSTKYGSTAHYPVYYSSTDETILTTTSTTGTGVFYILNVDPDDMLVIAAQKDGFQFNIRTYDMMADTVSQGRLTGTPLPTISGFTPTSATPGSTVTINGTNFNTNQFSNTVCFGSFCSTPISATSNQLLVNVPCNANNGPIRVITNSLSVTSSDSFSIAAPTITSIFPTQGPLNANITINGTNFGNSCGGNQVRFNGQQTFIVNWFSPTQIAAYVPYGATNGPVTVTTGGGTADGPTYTVLPTPSITSTAPDSGPIGTVVTVTGSFYEMNPDMYNVMVDGFIATVNSVTASSLTFTIPNGISSLASYTIEYFGVSYWNGSFTVTPKLTVAISGSGSGSVNSNPSGTSCSGAWCRTYDYNTPITLTASPSVGSDPGVWGGDCGSGPTSIPCNLTMNANKTVTATFLVQDNARLGSGTTPYATVLEAYNAATVAGTVIKLRDKAFTEALNADNGTTVTLSGGYAAGFGATHTGVTSITSLIISLGSLTIDNLTIK